MDHSAVGTPGGPPADGLYLIGFAVRAELDQCMADLERARTDFSEIPVPVFQRVQIPAEALHELPEQASIPVLDIFGEQLANWSAERYLSALADFRKNPAVQIASAASAPAPDAAATSEPPYELPPDDWFDEGDSAGPVAEAAPPAKKQKPAPAPEHVAASAPRPRPTLPVPKKQEAAPATGSRWMGEMILGALPQALFASDLEGNTLFYNERFESAVLARPVLKNSIRFAENFLLELNRTLLAESFAADPRRKGSQALSTWHPELKLRVRVQNLEHEGRIQGYLYIFHEPGEGELFQQFVDRVVRGEGLETITDEVESQFIYLMLERHGQNVSHTARALKIKRSTLQNKMKRLRIDERFDRQVSGPVRRHRRTTRELQADRAAEVTLAEAMQDSRDASAMPDELSAARAASNAAAKPAPKKTASGKAVKKTAKPSGAKSAKKTVKKVAKKVAGKSAKKSTQKPAKKATKKTAKKAAKRATQKTAKKAGKKAAANRAASKKAAKKTASRATQKSAKKSAKKPSAKKRKA